MNEALKVFVDNKVISLCTSDSQSKPHIRFMEVQEVVDNKLLIATSLEKDLYRQVEFNNNLAASLQVGGIFYRLDGYAEFVDKVKYILDNNPAIAKQYVGDEDLLVTFYINVTKLTVMDITKEKPEINVYT